MTITNSGVAINMNKTRKCHSAYGRFKNTFGNVFNASVMKRRFLNTNKNAAGCNKYIGSGGRRQRKGTRRGRKGTRRHR